jgi:hypothetical protein
MNRPYYTWKSATACHREADAVNRKTRKISNISHYPIKGKT